MQSPATQRRVAELQKKISVLAEMITEAIERGALTRSGDLRARVAELSIEVEREINQSEAGTETADAGPRILAFSQPKYQRTGISARMLQCRRPAQRSDIREARHLADDRPLA